jgi:NAD(P)-dependent dehydrogenase (short-subunit alcohol dehydrogenase family)
MSASPLPSPFPTWHNDVYPAIDPIRPELSQKGKHIVITGGGSGIGVSIVRAFALAGAKDIGIIGRTEKTLLDTKSKIEAEFKDTPVYTAVADIVDTEAIKKAFATLTSQNGGKIDVLVNNAGYLPDPGFVKESKVGEWWRGYEVR